MIRRWLRVEKRANNNCLIITSDTSLAKGGKTRLTDEELNVRRIQIKLIIFVVNPLKYSEFSILLLMLSRPWVHCHCDVYIFFQDALGKHSSSI